MTQNRQIPLLTVFTDHAEIGRQSRLLHSLFQRLLRNLNRHRHQLNLGTAGGKLVQRKIQLFPRLQRGLAELDLAHLTFFLLHLPLEGLHLLAQRFRFLQHLLILQTVKGYLGLLLKQLLLLKIRRKNIDGRCQPGLGLFQSVEIHHRALHHLLQLLITIHRLRIGDLQAAAAHQLSQNLLSIAGKTIEEKFFHSFNHLVSTILSTISAAA